jgi:hypothetical protein
MLVKSSKENNVIKADTLNATTLAGVSAFVVGIAGAVPPILKAFGVAGIPPNALLGGLLLIGLAVIGWAIATAGDGLARAYATAHVKTDKNTPALAEAIQALAANYQNAALGVEATDGKKARKPATAKAIERLADAQENASLGITSDQRAVPDRMPPLADAIKVLATAHEHAALGITSDKKGVSDQRPAVATGLEAVAAALSRAPDTTLQPTLVPMPAGVKVTVEGHRHRVLGALLTHDDPPSIRLLLVDDSGTTRVLPHD